MHIRVARSKSLVIALVVLFSALAAYLLLPTDAGPQDPNDPNFPIADTNGDLLVNIVDLSYLLSKWQQSDTRADFTGDGFVNIADLSYMLAQWLRQDTVGSQVPLVIYDTDMGPDIDDVLALAMLHSYRDMGEIELAAVTISRGTTNSARFTDAINTFYGRPTIPIGVYRGGTVSSDQANNDRFTVLASNYPHDVHQSPIPDGYRVMREVLARAERENRRVIIIQTGFSGTVSALLNSGGDSISSKSGMQLVRDNVDLLSIMAGNFGSSSAEFNVAKDLSSARNVFSRWPVAMTVSDWRVGAGVVYPYQQGIANLFASNHPVRAAYEFQTLSWHPPNNPFYNMYSWDLTSVIEAIEPDANYFARSGQGTVTLDSSGRSFFNANSSGPHNILTVPGNRQRAINRMIELVR